MGKNSFKPLSEELTEHYEQEAPPYVMFMAAKDEIEKALAEGWKITKIWRLMHMKGRIRCGYSTFARYIKDYIRQQTGKRSPSQQRGTRAKGTTQGNGDAAGQGHAGLAEAWLGAIIHAEARSEHLPGRNTGLRQQAEAGRLP